MAKDKKVKLKFQTDDRTFFQQLWDILLENVKVGLSGARTKVRKYLTGNFFVAMAWTGVFTWVNGKLTSVTAAIQGFGPSRLIAWIYDLLICNHRIAGEHMEGWNGLLQEIILIPWRLSDHFAGTDYLTSVSQQLSEGVDAGWFVLPNGPQALAGLIAVIAFILTQTFIDARRKLVGLTVGHARRVFIRRVKSKFNPDIAALDFLDSAMLKVHQDFYRKTSKYPGDNVIEGKLYDIYLKNKLAWDEYLSTASIKSFDDFLKKNISHSKENAIRAMDRLRSQGLLKVVDIMRGKGGSKDGR